jgi:hypothetical protein
LNQTKRLEILEAFASSKPTEFDGFTALYLEQHPEQPEPLVSLQMDSPIELSSIVDERFQSDDDATLTFSEKPVSKRKRK